MLSYHGIESGVHITRIAKVTFPSHWLETWSCLLYPMIWYKGLVQKVLRWETLSHRIKSMFSGLLCMYQHLQILLLNKLMAPGARIICLLISRSDSLFLYATQTRCLKLFVVLKFLLQAHSDWIGSLSRAPLFQETSPHWQLSESCN